MKGRTWIAFALGVAGAVLLGAGCAPSAVSTVPGGGATSAVPTLASARAGLLGKLDTLRVSGAVKTADGILLPETIRVEIRTEVCTEFRAPGSRFWSLDYDTCFVYVSADTVDSSGAYDVAIPCLDADREYLGSFPFGELRLVPKGPVSFLAESDGGWKHQETFTSARSQQRDLLLSFEPHAFFVITPKASFCARPDSAAAVTRTFPFGQEMQVIRFHLGWAECLTPDGIGWMEMKCLGTKEDVAEREPHYRKAGLVTGE